MVINPGQFVPLFADLPLAAAQGVLRFLALRDVGECTEHAQRRALDITQGAAARQHPAVAAISGTKTELDPVICMVIPVPLQSLPDSVAIVWMNAGEQGCFRVG